MDSGLIVCDDICCVKFYLVRSRGLGDVYKRQVMDSGLIVCDDICCVKFYKLLFMECIFVCCFDICVIILNWQLVFLYE